MNQFGYGDYQETMVTQVLLRTVPSQMLPVTRNDETDYNEIVIDW